MGLFSFLFGGESSSSNSPSTIGSDSTLGNSSNNVTLRSGNDKYTGGPRVDRFVGASGRNQPHETTYVKVDPNNMKVEQGWHGKNYDHGKPKK